MTHSMRRLLQATMVITASISLLSGCADMERRYREGPGWIAEAEKQRQELQRQGFPQYSPML